MVSAALEGSGARTAHEHRWMEGAPSHPGVHETTASSGLADVADAPRVASFLRDVARFADAPSLERWRELLLDPTYGSVADASLHFMRFPEEGYADRAAFSRWWKPSQFALWNRLREETEAD